MKEMAVALSLAGLASWCSEKPNGKPPSGDHPQEQAGEAAEPGDPLIKAMSRQGAKSTAELEGYGASAVILKVEEGGKATAFDYSEFGYEGSTGTELAHLTLAAGELQEIRDGFRDDLESFRANDERIRLDLEAILVTEKSNCPDCTHEYAGDVGTMSLFVVEDGERHRAFYSTDMYRPEKVYTTTEFIDGVIAARKRALALRESVLERGDGSVPLAVALAKVEQSKNPAALPGVFRGRDCFFSRDTGGEPPSPDKIICGAYPEGHTDGDGATPLSLAEVEVAKLPAGPITVKKYDVDSE